MTVKVLRGVVRGKRRALTLCLDLKGYKTGFCMNNRFVYDLVPEGIDKASEQIKSALLADKCKNEDVLRICLSVESILIKWMNQESAHRQFGIEFKKRLKKIYVIVEIEGNVSNPFEADTGLSDDPILSIITRKMADDGVKPAFKRTLSISTLTYACSKNDSNALVDALIAIICAFITWRLMLMLPGNIADEILNTVTNPLFYLILDLMSAIAVFLIFVSTISGLYGLGGGTKLKAYLKVILKGTMVPSVVMGLISIGIFMLVYPLYGQGSGLSGDALKSVYEMILNIVPGNFISPFLEKNTLQVTFLGIFSGIILSQLAHKTKGITSIIVELDLFFTKAITTVCRLVPLVIFLSFLNLLLSDKLGNILNAWKGLLTILVVLILYLAGVYIQNSFILGKSPLEFAEYFGVIGINGFMTASSYGCMGMIKDSLKERFDVEEEDFSFLFSIMQILLKADFVIIIIAYAFISADISNVSFDLTNIILLFISSILFAIATPSVTGALMTTLVALFKIAGIPLEAMAIIVSVNPIVDMFQTSVKVMAMPVIIAALDKKLKRVR